MSQNKTVIQGLEPADSQSYNGNVSPNFYSRGGYSAARGTVVPGMTDRPTNVSQEAPSQQAAYVHQPHSAVASGKPVVGFLYSISRTAVGEYWPLHIGQNVIGQNTSNDVVLAEGTVSGEHAVIVIRKMKNPEKVIASISDARSTNGTMINGNSLGFSAVECKNGDIITIGDNYELLLILIDASLLGLRVQENFIETQHEDNPIDEAPMIPGYTRPGEDYLPNGGFTPPPFSGGHVAGGTVGLDGLGIGEKGGTIGM